MKKQFNRANPIILTSIIIIGVIIIIGNSGKLWSIIGHNITIFPHLLLSLLIGISTGVLTGLLTKLRTGILTGLLATLLVGGLPTLGVLLQYCVLNIRILKPLSDILAKNGLLYISALILPIILTSILLKKYSLLKKVSLLKQIKNNRYLSNNNHRLFLHHAKLYYSLLTVYIFSYAYIYIIIFLFSIATFLGMNF